MTNDPVPSMESAARAAAHIAAFECRKNGVMPFKVRVSVWTEDYEHPGRYISHEFESLIDAVAYEKSYQEWIATHSAPAPVDSDPVDKKEVLDDVLHFINEEDTPENREYQDPDEEEKGTGE